MNDGQIREILARALPDRPLTTSVTREAAVAAGRRALRQRRQRLQVLAAGALAVLALGAGAPQLIAQIGTGTATQVPVPSVEPTSTAPSASPAPAPSQTASANTSPRPGRPMPVKTPTGVAVQLSDILRSAAGKLMPYAVFGSTEVAFEDATYLLNPFDVIDNGHGYYIALAQIVNQSRVGTLSVAIWPGDDGRKAPSSGCTAGFAQDCQTRVGPNGEQVTITTRLWTDTTITEYRVVVDRPDGTILSGLITMPSPDVPPPIATDEIATLLFTPGLTLHP